MSGERPGGRAVVVTGLGVASVLGCEVQQFWDRVTSGTDGTREITRFPVAGYPTSRAGEVDPAGLSDAADPGARDLPRSVRYALHAAGRALDDAKAADIADPNRFGVFLGTVMGTRPHLEELRRAGRALARDLRWDTPSLLVTEVAGRYGLRGPRQVFGSGCAAGNTALALAADEIRAGRADAMLAGGSDELSESVFQLFTSLRALTPDVARPFDAGRRGMLPAEGAAVLLLESAEHALERGATPLAELAGWAVAADAHHMTAPHPEGLGMLRCMDRSLAMAGAAPAQVDYVSAHGTGTVVNDAIEARCLTGYFDRCGGRPAVSSVKGMLGHAQGGASALEAVVCVRAVRDGVVPGNPTMREPDPACAGLDVITGDRREMRVGVALSNAFGFGGNTATVVFTDWPG